MQQTALVGSGNSFRACAACSEIAAIVSHKGRSADSGHYMAWVRKDSGDDWLVFDDDSVSESEWATVGCVLCVHSALCRSVLLSCFHNSATTEYVLSHLKGGGDDHMQYLMFYKASC
jgi:ubiquitin carboxyl-terminal hydrolase 14